eukprot:gene8096-1340_t
MLVPGGRLSPSPFIQKESLTLQVEGECSLNPRLKPGSSSVSSPQAEAGGLVSKMPATSSQSMSSFRVGSVPAADPVGDRHSSDRNFGAPKWSFVKPSSSRLSNQGLAFTREGSNISFRPSLGNLWNSVDIKKGFEGEGRNVDSSRQLSHFRRTETTQNGALLSAGNNSFNRTDILSACSSITSCSIAYHHMGVIWPLEKPDCNGIAVDEGLHFRTGAW